jgi:hypothetical protein
VLPAQHAWPAAPQLVQVMAPPQMVLVAVQVLPVQHVDPAAPQVPHAPLVHAPPMPGHAEPIAVHCAFTQQPPPVQALPAQQGSPGPPHRAQVAAPPAPVQSAPVSHCRPGQQV